MSLVAGADALVLQGFAAGGHRGSFDDLAPQDFGLLALLRLVAGITAIPLIASGGLFDGAGIAATLVAGAAAAQLGTAFMRDLESAAPSAYPEIHHLTSPLRSAAKAANDPDGFHLWAGQAHAQSRALPASDLMDALAAETQAALASAAETRIA